MEETNADFMTRRNNEEKYSAVPDGKMTFVRHGATRMNSDGDKIRGWRDISLDPEGVEEAEKTAKKLPPVDCIYSSDLERAVQTAEILSKAQPGVSLKLSEDLRPWDLGVFTGAHSTQIQEKIRHYVENPDEPVPKGESFNTFKNRFLSFIINLKRDHPMERIAIVSHYRGDRVLRAWEVAGSRPDMEIDKETFLKRSDLEPGAMRKM